MRCPFCDFPDTQVVDSRPQEEGHVIRRRRRCEACSQRFSTYERAELNMPRVVKSNGQRMDFDPQRLRQSLVLALHKRPVSEQELQAALSRVQQQLLQLGEAEVSSRAIGDAVMLELHRLDKVGYIRFASVYRNFTDAGDFQRAVSEVKKPHPK